MNYIGSKYSLIDFLEESIDKTLKFCNESRKPSEMVFAVYVWRRKGDL